MGQELGKPVSLPSGASGSSIHGRFRDFASGWAISIAAWDRASVSVTPRCVRRHQDLPMRLNHAAVAGLGERRSGTGAKQDGNRKDGLMRIVPLFGALRWGPTAQQVAPCSMMTWVRKEAWICS
jgi:hypothetical protein